MAGSDSQSPLILRWWAVALGISTFVWLPYEDTHVYFVLALSAGWSSWAAGQLIRKFRFTINSARLTGICAASGLAVTPFAILLIILKAGLHDHGFLDLTTNQLLFILKSTPLWVLLGLITAGIYIRVVLNGEIDSREH